MISLKPQALGVRSDRRRTSRSEELSRSIADDIIHARLAAGTRLDEHELAERFGTSLTPVREALAHLYAIGMVERVPDQGVVVAVIEPERVQEMFGVMAELEAAAARLAARLMTPVERRALEDLHLASREMVRQGSREAYANYNMEFHAMLYAGSHNSYLEELLLATRKRLNPIRRAQFNLLGRLAASHGEHDLVVQAVLRGDGVAAAEAMRSHLLTVAAMSAEYISRHLSGGGSGSEES